MKGDLLIESTTDIAKAVMGLSPLICSLQIILFYVSRLLSGMFTSRNYLHSLLFLTQLTSSCTLHLTTLMYKSITKYIKLQVFWLL